MCTAICFTSGDFYFGRNLDLDHHYQEAITVTPRNYAFQFRNGSVISNHYAMIGMATVCHEFPLYYEATNEVGLSMAGLHFPGNALYYPKAQTKDNIAPFELIPWILSQCRNIEEAKTLLSKLNLWNMPFSDEYTLTPLHWIIADKERSIVLESTEAGQQTIDDPVGVLTNNPPLPYHLTRLQEYRNLTVKEPGDAFSVEALSLGMGAIGLPGDLSSPSRFTRAAFFKSNAAVCDTEETSVTQFFHLLDSVAQIKGLVYSAEGNPHYTVYSSCCNTVKGIYYYKTYHSTALCTVDMHKECLDSNRLITYPMSTETRTVQQNGESL